MTRMAKCPRCGQHTGTFFAATETPGIALYRCNTLTTAHLCGGFFRTPHPPPQPRQPAVEARAA
jgi:rRNA maturation protein Nop10